MELHMSKELKLNFVRTVRSEIIKFRSLRSNWVTLISTIFSIFFFGAISSFSAIGGVDTGDGPDFASLDPVSVVLSGTNFALLIVGVFGAVLGAREYASGMIKLTFTAVPNRLNVLWAKLLVFLVAMLPGVLISTLLVFNVGMGILESGGADTVAWDDPGVSRAVIGAALYVVGIGVIGLGLGVLLRNIAGSIGMLIGGVLFVPSLLTALLPASWSEVLKYLPSNAGRSFTEIYEIPNLLDAETGIWVFACWVVLAIFVTALQMQKRDA
jgi:ABC-2 type transport system permease protein